MDPWIAVPALMALLALVTKGLDRLSAITGGIMGYMILFLGGWEWLVLLMIFFALSTAATHYKKSVKKRHGLSQKKRMVENVLGNGLVALIFAMQGNLFGFAASLASATADTMSSEIGVLSKKKPVNILDFKTVMKHGANGGISTLGNIMTFVGSISIAGACLFLFGGWTLFWIVLWSGVFGCIVDSVLGATLENDGVIGNHLVNLLSTLSAGLMAISLASLF